MDFMGRQESGSNHPAAKAAGYRQQDIRFGNEEKGFYRSGLSSVTEHKIV